MQRSFLTRELRAASAALFVSARRCTSSPSGPQRCLSLRRWSGPTEFATRGCEPIREPCLRCCAPLVAQMGQKAPIRVQYARLTEPVHMLLRREVMELQAVDLASQARGRLPLLAEEVLHHPDRLQLLLERTVERDLTQALVDLRLGHRQARVVGRNELDQQHIR